MKPINKVILFVITVYSISLFLYWVSHGTYIDSHFDLVFETNTLAIIIYVYFIARPTILTNTKLKYGVRLLLFAKIYDIVTEISYLDALSDRYELADAFIEDGSQQAAYILIAIGLTELMRKAEESAMTDELTGLYNRKKLPTIPLEKFDLIYFDLDGLKQENDTKGHAEGDLILIQFAEALVTASHHKETIFRVGGDEFVVATTLNRSSDFLGALKEDLENKNIKYSYGVESTNKADLNEALLRTDKAMYKMKNSQSNRN
ncbi:GGDEF domain-containing protein [Vibrio lamellibrachiae]|uniref:GGDEF domain-containing protein n=1 Tax=Vibrio lamellibrachiae TaxID=2910253 RepID=UPI003D0BF4B4